MRNGFAPARADGSRFGFTDHDRDLAFDGTSARVAVAELGLVLDPEQAAQTADMWLFETWSARERASFTLPPSRLAVEPGDVLTVSDGQRTHVLRVTEVAERGARDIAALSLDADVYAPAPVPLREAANASVAVAAGQPLIAFLDLPLLQSSDPAASAYVAAAQEPWPGGIAVYKSPEQAGFALACVAAAPAVTGHTLDPLPMAPSGRWTEAAPLRVVLDRGSLASVTDLALLSGANLAAVANPDGEWEVLQFSAATLVAPATYALSGFLRGQLGTEHAMRASLPANAPFVLLDGAVTRLDLSPDDVGLAFAWRCGPANKPIGDAAYLSATHAFRGEGQRPLSPVHITCARAANGDAAISWIRRTRVNGDSWEGLDVPLSEDQERYAVDVLAGSAIVRSFSTTSPTALYTATNQTADFGSPQDRISLRIAQVSATFGNGTPALATV